MAVVQSIVSVILGAGIIWGTWYMQSITDVPPAFSAFYFLGGAFIASAAFSLLKWYVTRDMGGPQTPIPERQIVRCSNCNTRHYSESNYCHMCGRKL